MHPALVLRSTCLLLALCGAARAHAAADKSEDESYALIVTNNRSLNESRPDLHYADDDGAKYAELFSQVMGREHVTLLTQFDPESRALYPAWDQSSQLPTLANLRRAVTQLGQKLAAARTRGVTTSVVFVFAGHGDVQNGQGFVELADGELSARDLEEQVVRPLPATHLHLILDSCNSYFMLNPRKAGGARFASQSTAETNGLLSRYPNLGALVSTSAEAVTYEWSEVQSGIFSYEVRSGLRGAADVNHDGRISYAELSAFINTANKPILNDLYRPKVFSGPPSHDGTAPLLTLDTRSARAHLLDVPSAGERRFTIRDAQGTRLLDVHKEDGTPLTLLLPEGGGLSLLETHHGLGDARPQVAMRDLGAAGRRELGALPEVPPTLATRGESPVFNSLFAQAFGARAFAEPPPPESTEDPSLYGISRRDAERLGRHLRSSSQGIQSQRVAVGLLFAAVGLGHFYPASDYLTRGDGFSAGLEFVESGALIAGGLTAPFLFHDPLQTLSRDYDKLDFSNERTRALNVAATEYKFRLLAVGAETRRKQWATAVGSAAVALAGADTVLFFGAGAPRSGRAGWYLSLAEYGIYLIGAIIYGTVYRDPIENAWDAYLHDDEVLGRRPVTSEIFGRVSVGAQALDLGPKDKGSGFSLKGHF